MRVFLSTSAMVNSEWPELPALWLFMCCWRCFPAQELPFPCCPHLQLKQCCLFRERTECFQTYRAMQSQAESRSSDQPYASPAFLIHLGTPPVDSSSDGLPAPSCSSVCGNVQLVAMSTRWQFSPQQHGDTRDSSAKLSPAQPCSFLPAQCMAPGQIINTGGPWDHVLHSRV